MTNATTSSTIPCTSVPAEGPVSTAKALRQQLGAGPHSLVLAFASPSMERSEFASALQAEFPSVAVLGCSTAGEIGPNGLGLGTVSAVAFPAADFRVAHGLVKDVRTAGPDECRALVERLTRELAASGEVPNKTNTFAVLLVDGMSVAEERIASSLSSALGGIDLVGGSAADGLGFQGTHVFEGGFAHEHGAVLALVQTNVPFVVWKTQHFVPGAKRLVVTSADAEQRIVYELNGEPAADYFAQSIGLQREDLDPIVFAKNPVVVRIGGSDFVRSIQQAGPDGSLTFYCAIEEGVVLRDAKGVGLVENLDEAIATIRAAVGEPQLALGFDCILRRFECERDDKMDAVSSRLSSLRCIGFSTYGEQFNGLHVNQTLTGVAFGSKRGT